MNIILNKFNFSILSFLTFFFIAFSSTSQADYSNDKCSHVLIASKNTLISRQWNENKYLCFIEVHPLDVTDLKYRDFYFDNTGHFMVFNSYGYGEDSEMSGFRDFFLFPLINEYPDFSIEDNGAVLIKTASNHVFKFSGETSALLSISEASVKELPLSPNNNGGVELSLNRGFWLDGGFKKGSGRLASPLLKSTLYSSKVPKLSTCKITHKDLFNYPEPQEFILKYRLTEDLDKFVQKKCPTLF